MVLRNFFSSIKQNPGMFQAIFAMMTCVSISNYLVQFPINDWLTWGAFPYPVCFLITELTNRLYGAKLAKIVVYCGFILGVTLSFFLNIPKIAIASGTAFLTAQLFDIAIFNRCKSNIWWLSPMAASSAASALDTIVFTTMAFWNEHMPVLTLALGDFSIKMLIDCAMLIPFRFFIAKWANSKKQLIQNS